MGFSLKNLKSGRRTIEVAYFDEVGMVTYNPGQITDDMLRTADEGENADENQLNKMLLQLIVAWELTDDGEDVPVSDDVVSSLPIPFKAAILTQVMEDAGNPKASRKP